MEGASEARSGAALAILRSTGAVLEEDHFVYISGDHGSGWIDKDAIFPDTKLASELGALLAAAVAELAAEIVCGPAIGGLIAAQWTAYHLGALAVFAEHAPSPPHHGESVPAMPGAALRSPFVLRRGFDRVVQRRRVLVVDDIVNTGHSVRQTVEAVRVAGGEVVGAACFCTRGNAVASDIGVERFVALTEILIPNWPAQECPLCRGGVPVNSRYAHGADYLARHPASGPAADLKPLSAPSTP